MSRIFIIIAVFCSFRGYSQFGFKAVSTFPKNRIAQISTGNKLFPFISGVGVDYWFRLKNYRLEFLPAVHFQYGHERLDLDQNIEGVLNWSVIDFVPSIRASTSAYNSFCDICSTEGVRFGGSFRCVEF